MFYYADLVKQICEHVATCTIDEVLATQR